MLSNSSNIQKNKTFYLPLLLLISVVSHFPFVLEGYGELDATRIGVSAIDMAKHGSDGAFINFYFTDVVPLYMLYLKLFLKIIKYKFDYLPVIMNYTNAVFGILTLIPAYFLIKRLFYNQEVAFFSVLALIFVPEYYQSTITGFPHLIALFFLLCSFYFYLAGLDESQKDFIFRYMMLSCLFLSLTLLFKLDYILGAGAYIGLLYVRRITNNKIIISTLLIVIVSCLSFFVFRHLIIGPTGGATSSSTGLSEWLNLFVHTSSPSFAYFKRQIKPVIYAAGLITFFLGIIAFIHYLLKRNFDVLIFFLSWAAPPTIAWIIINGNNARHNLLSILPFLVMIVMFFFKIAPKLTAAFTVILILGNYFITSPSSSILTPSGNLFKSHSLLENRMIELHSRAKEITDLKEKKIVVLGYFHNPHVIFEIQRSDPSYKAVKIGREDYKIKTGNKEYTIFYFVIDKPGDMEKEIDRLLSKYSLSDHLFVSATYDLNPLERRGFKTKSLNIIKSAL
jgi:hypothetical protein